MTNYFLRKRVVITGASSGIGQGLSYFYLNQGATVILVGKDELTLKTIAQQYPTQAVVVITNITDDYQCKVSLTFFIFHFFLFQDLVEAVKHKFMEQDNIMAASGMKTFNQAENKEEYQPRLDILINAAGIIFAGDLDSTFPQDHDYLMDVNLRAPYVLTNFF